MVDYRTGQDGYRDGALRGTADQHAGSISTGTLGRNAALGLSLAR